MKLNEIDPLSLHEWYEMIPDPYSPNTDYWCVRITKGDFAGLVYKYGNIRINPFIDEDNETITANFEYDIIDLPVELRTKEFQDEVKLEFETFLGNIMMEIIHRSFKEEDIEHEFGSDRDDDTEKLIVRRRIRTENSAFHKA